MKLVNNRHISKLNKYFRKRKKLLNKTLRVLGILVTEEEWNKIIDFHLLCYKIFLKYGGKPPIPRSKHEPRPEEHKQLKACLLIRRKHPNMWLKEPYEEIPKSPLVDILEKNHIDIDNFDYIIIIRESAVYMEAECSFCVCKDDCPNLLGYLTHEFVHIVEEECGTKILPEDHIDCYYYIGELIKKIFKDELVKAENFHLIFDHF